MYSEVVMLYLTPFSVTDVCDEKLGMSYLVVPAGMVLKSSLVVVAVPPAGVFSITLTRV